MSDSLRQLSWTGNPTVFSPTPSEISSQLYTQSQPNKTTHFLQQVTMNTMRKYPSIDLLCSSSPVGLASEGAPETDTWLEPQPELRPKGRSYLITSKKLKGNRHSSVYASRKRRRTRRPPGVALRCGNSRTSDGHASNLTKGCQTSSESRVFALALAFHPANAKPACAPSALPLSRSDSKGGRWKVDSCMAWHVLSRLRDAPYIPR